MINLSWSEVRDRAIAFSRAFGDETSEAGGKQTFWNEFFDVFGKERRTVATFEVPVKNLQGKYNYIDLLWRGTLLVEHKSAGKSLSNAESQAFDYIQDLLREGRNEEVPRFVILSDFLHFALYDLEPEEQQDLPIFAGMHYTVTTFPLAELPKFVRHFAFIKGERTLRIVPEDPANQKAYDLMCQLHDELKRGGFTGTDLEKLLVRVLFCLFAEDTNVFEPNAFVSFVRDQTREDGSDLGARLNELFHVLNTPSEHRSSGLYEALAIFPYVNGRLFADSLGFASFKRSMRARLLEAADFQWARVSPAVFGSLFQGIMEDTARRQQGAHYTSERDIIKVIRSLFLDDLRAEFDTIRADKTNRRTARLQAFHDRLRTLRFLDPACGCGNFLVLAYRELRLLELDLLRELHSTGQQVFEGHLIQVDVDQFHGIEYAEWPARIAEVAMWLMDHQMNQFISEAFGHTFERLPLRTSANIVQGNALRLDWREVLPPRDGVFVLGNPPFVGKQFRTAEQQAEMEAIWDGVKGAGVLDYVTCWYRKAAEYIAGTRITVAFVSTNSITQGEQVGILWGELFDRWRLKIHFAHRTFAWQSEARGKAHVHVVIVGFGTYNPDRKCLYDYDVDLGHVVMKEVANISPYLIEANDIVVQKRVRSICSAPELVFGSMPNDNGHLLLSAEERRSLLAIEPGAARYLRPILGSEEFLNGVERWCLWLVDAAPGDLRQLPEVRRRVDGVRIHRSASPRETTRNLASRPTLFGEIRQPTTNYLLIPGVSSLNRRYTPIGFMSSEVIASNLVYCLAGATLWHFGVLSSAIHMAWVKVVAGRLKSDYRYSNQLVYNNFPWPTDVVPKHQSAVTDAAEAVLAARVPFLPPHGTCTLADLYDPLAMPATLVKAHAALDRAVDRCYRPEPFKSDRDRVEHLFARYEALTAPLLPASPERGKRGRKKPPRGEDI
jgi:hypothetical protein